mgnify:CR=1 FL=1
MWTGLLLFDNLAVVWWYAHLTGELARTSRKQFDLAAAQHLQANKPIVITERIEDPHTRAFHYFIRNVGAGTAINVWFLDDDSKVSPRVRSLGALAAKGSRLLIAEVEGSLCNSGGNFRHVLAAEGIISRTSQWTLTLNARSSQAGGEMTHCLARITAVDSSRTIEQLIKDEWADLRIQLSAMPNIT